VRPERADATPVSRMMLTAEDIARVTGAPLRTARDRLARWAARPGSDVTKLPRSGPGRRPWSISLDAYCARVGLDPADVLEALGETQAVAA